MGITPSAYNQLNHPGGEVETRRKSLVKKQVSMAEKLVTKDEIADAPKTAKGVLKKKPSTTPDGKRTTSLPRAAVGSSKVGNREANRSKSPSPKAAKKSPRTTGTLQNLKDQKSKIPKEDDEVEESPKSKKGKKKSKSKSRGRKSKSKSRKRKGKSKSKTKSKSKNRKRSPKRGKKKKTRSKSKKSNRSKSKKAAKVAPMPDFSHNDDTAKKMFSVRPTQTFESDEDNDVDQLSVEMTQDDFIQMLQEERGAYILEDLTEQYRDQFFGGNEDEDGQFGDQTKQLLKQLAINQNLEGDQGVVKKKLKEFIQDLDLQGKNLFRNHQTQSEEVKEGDTQFQVQNPFHSQLQEQQVNVLTTQDDLMPKTKVLKKKKSNVSSQRAFDAYFNYLPFEKAVIESNGRTPFSNKDVERIVNKQKNGKVAPMPQSDGSGQQK